MKAERKVIGPAGRWDWRHTLLLGSALTTGFAATLWASRPRRDAGVDRRRVPRALKLGYAGFVCVLVPAYWRAYGPTNFLWLSDLALFGTTASLILESPLLAGMAAVGALPLELAWNIDFAARGRLLGLSAYMFERETSLGLRGLSLFHVALPPTLLWLLRRFGYDRRAFGRQAVLVSVLLPATYAITRPDANINWVFGPGVAPQHRLPPWLYLALEMAAIPALAMLPAHLALKRFFPPAPR